MLKKFFKNASPRRFRVGTAMFVASSLLVVCLIGQTASMFYKIHKHKQWEATINKKHEEERRQQGVIKHVFAENADQLTKEMAAHPDANWVGMYGRTVHSDGTFAVLEKISDLRIVTALRANIDNENLRHLANLTELRRVDFWDASVDNEGLAHLRKLVKLQELSLYETKITDDGFAELKSLVSLQSLSLDGDGITGAGLRHLDELPNLNHIGLHGPTVTDDGIKSLTQLKKLSWVNLYNSGITDKGMKTLGACKGITDLYLVKTAITDEGLQELASLDKLETLDVSDTAVTSAGVAKLKKALPNVQVKYGPWTAANEGLEVLYDLGWYLALAIAAMVVGFRTESYMRRTIEIENIK